MKREKINCVVKAIALMAVFTMFPVYARILFSTITVSGYYRLADDLDNSITITVGDVTLDLNGHTVNNATGSGIIINAGLDQIAILNGTVQALSDAVQVNSGCSNITLENITAKNAVRGMYFDNVMNGVINNCEMTSNVTGLQLQNSQKINVTNSVASSNMHAGFDLLSSTTNIFIDCKALSTGSENLLSSNNLVIGFNSVDGYGNIFERCIANSTQALSTTDSNSVIAGFALGGTESSSKIIGCEAANAMTNAAGFTVPYGILLEGSVSQYLSVTGLFQDSQVYEISWSPDGQYVVIGGNSLPGLSTVLQVVQFDRNNNSFIPVAGALTGGDTVFSVAWSPDGQYIAAGGFNLTGLSNALQIIRFDRTSNSCIPVVGVLQGSVEVQAVSWSPDGQYLAVGGSVLTGSSSAMQVLQFNRNNNSCISVAGVLNASTQVASISWSPDGQYLAVGGQGLTGLSDVTQILKFDRGANSCTPVAGALNGSAFLNAVSWSSDGQYVVVGGGGLVGSSSVTQILRFDRSNNSYTSVAGALNGSSFINGLSWSSDGQYVVVGGQGLVGLSSLTQILRFDRSTPAYTPIAGASGGLNAVNAVVWSPDGQYVALGGSVPPGVDGAQMLTGLDFPSKNVICNNTVYCNSGGQFPSGAGISGPSICNLIIDNKAYSNPVQISANNPIIGTNYFFVCNVFNQLFGQAPSALQNIALDTCGIIAQPLDTAFIAEQILYNSTVILSELDVISSAVDALDNCGATSLTNADISGGLITLSSSGNYCLSTNLTTNITISASNVTLNLNGRQLAGVISVSSADDVTIENGEIAPPAPSSAPAAAITINSASDRTLVKNITIVCANSTGAGVAGRAGISMDGTNAQILNCTISTGAGFGGAVSVAGSGGTGIQVTSNGINNYISGCFIVTGNGGDRVAAGSTVQAGNGGTGIQVDNGALKTEIIDCIIYGTGNGGSVDQGNATSAAGNGGNGIVADSDDIHILRCTIKTGFAGDIAGGGTPAGGTAGAGGSGIVVGSTAIKNLIEKCSIVTGAGGSAGGAGGIGGNGGNGVTITSATRTEILDCIIYGTGAGGSSTTGGNGGHGISINSSAIATSVRNSTIRNTGIAGTGGSSALPGKAIFDQSTGSGVSSIYANFANNIANGTKYDLLAMGLESGILLPNPPTATVINPYANVYSS